MQWISLEEEGNKRTESLFEETMLENFPNLMEDTNINI